MCLCWDRDETGKVIGICNSAELARRIHDPDYMPELKAAKRAMVSKLSEERQAMYRSLSDERKEELRQSWLQNKLWRASCSKR